MAVRTLRQHLLIDDHRLVSNHPDLCVTLVTGDIRVSTLQRKMRPRIVIENGRNPTLRIVTIRAGGLSGLRKLAGVDIFMTILTNLRRPLELHFFRAHGYLVTSAALHRTMRTEQRELGFAVIKAVYVGPRPGVMAGLATERRAIGAALRHAILEFATMRVLMACGAGHVFEDKRQDFVSTSRRAYFMAIGARYRRVRANQCETSVAMFGNRKGGAMKIHDGMTILAFILIRRANKLAVMCIFMAVQAGCKFHLVDRVFAYG